MTVNFGSELLDVLFALAFVYFLLSLIVSAGTEGISWFLQQRASNLEEGLKTLLGDKDESEQLTQDLLAHPLVKGLTKGRMKYLPKANLPSYVAPRNFALALVDLIESPDTELEDAIDGLPDDLKKQLEPMRRAVGGDIDKFRESVEHWYDDSMDRVAGWYKRWAQAITIALAVVVTIGFNVSTIRVADRLFNDESVRNSVVAAGENTLKERTKAKEAGDSAGNAGVQGASGTKPAETKATKVAPPAVTAGEEAENAADTLTALALPVGWGSANRHFDPALLAGWLLTAIAISLGAPFWFGALGKLADLRTTGAKPKAGGGSDSGSDSA
jgi:hypothetical protein